MLAKEKGDSPDQAAPETIHVSNGTATAAAATTLPPALQALAAYPQFVLYRTQPGKTPGKLDKQPCNAQGRVCDSQDPANWLSADEAGQAAQRLGAGYGIGFVFTAADPFFFLDLDGVLQDDGQWSPLAQTLCAAFAGCAVEVSISGKGLHIFGVGDFGDHAIQPVGFPGGLYTERRFVALTGTHAVGDAGHPARPEVLRWLVDSYFPHTSARSDRGAEWTDGPVDGWNGPVDDDELIEQACRIRAGARAALTGRPLFAQLWTADAEVLGDAYPDGARQGRPYDSSSADSALATWLLMLTGRDCERTLRLMHRSGLVREKYDRPDYLPRTITRALQTQPKVWEWDRGTVTATTAGGAVDGPFGAPLVPWEIRLGTSSTRALTDLGNAHRLADTCNGQVYFVFDVGAWVIRPRGAWEWDPDGAAVRERAAGLSAQIAAEGERAGTRPEAFAAWALKSQGAHTIRNAVALLQDFSNLRVHSTLLDDDPWLVGVDGARVILDLRTGQTRAAEPGDLVTKTLGVSEVGDASKCVRWRAFLAEVLRAEVIDWLQRWCGYLLTGETREHMLLFAFGAGRNGKGTFSETLRMIMGDYARSVSAETLTDSSRKAGDASPDIAALRGARMALTSETELQMHLAEGLVKKLTGGDTIESRALYSAQIDFKPQFKLLVTGNHKPVIRGTDPGIWSRIRLLPFERNFQEEELDRMLPDRLREEAPHILAWMAEGCLAWQRRGLTDQPEVMKQALAAYRDEMDLIGEFLREHCVHGAQQEVTRSALYAAYRGWAVGEGLKPATNAFFSRRVRETGVGEGKSNGARGWKGIGLRQTTPWGT